MIEPLLLRRTTIELILELRHALLRPGLPQEAAQFDGDTLTGTAHFGAFVAERNVGCLSFMQATWQGRSALQLRGMAVAQAWQRHGVGSALLRFALAECAAEPVWCNARLFAVAFYERHGFVIVGDTFEIAGVGPHKQLLLMR